MTVKEYNLPLDVDKGCGREVRQEEVEGSVGCCGEGNSLTPETKWEELRWVDPGNGTLSWSIGSDKQICTSNYDFICCTTNDPRLFRCLIKTWSHWVAARSKQTLANMKIVIRVVPIRRGLRWPHQSMKINANTVMKTLIVYCMDEAMRLAEPVRPVIPNT